MRRPALLAVDGGGSKVDAVLVARDGSVGAAVRFRNTDHDGTSSDAYLDGVELTVSSLRAISPRPGRLPMAGLGMYCLAGADLPSDDRRIARWLGAHGWTGADVLRNDTFAVLRAGTERSGSRRRLRYSTHCSGAPGGKTFRFPARRRSGDGRRARHGSMSLWYALRAQDGRGRRTVLSSVVPEHFGLRRPRQVMEAMYFQRVPSDRVVELPPLVFRAAANGDAVARSIVDRQADEVVAMAGTAIRRLRMTALDVDVVLGGGIFRNEDPAFHARIEGPAGVARGADRQLTAPPFWERHAWAEYHHASRPAKARLRTAPHHEPWNVGSLEARGPPPDGRRGPVHGHVRPKAEVTEMWIVLDRITRTFSRRDRVDDVSLEIETASSWS